MEILFAIIIFLLALMILLAVLFWRKKNILTKKEEQLVSLQIENATLKENLLGKENLGGLIKSNFQNIANKIFEQKNEILVRHNKQQIDGLLNPLQQKIRDFENQFRENQNKTTQERTYLKSELEQLKNINQTIGEEAKNLTQTLKGDKRLQGHWGELVLENILEHSGLVQGREYEIQKQYSQTTDSGLKKLRPDVILHLPKGKKIVIDSKVSLVHYDSFIHAENEQEKTQAKKKQEIAMRQHIQDLHKKKYTEIPENSLDFVIMFVPIESAFILLTDDYQIYQEAYRLGVIPLCPSILMGFLKTIYKIWNLEKQDENARKIVEEASKMYDKFALFVENFQKIGNSLQGSLESYENAKKQLFDGRGNLVTRSKNLKELGIHTNKSIPR